MDVMKKSLFYLFFLILFYALGLISICLFYHDFNSFEAFQSKFSYYFENSWMGYLLSVTITSLLMVKKVEKTRSFVPRFLKVFNGALAISFLTIFIFFLKVSFFVPGSSSIDLDQFQELVIFALKHSLSIGIYFLPFLLITSLMTGYIVKPRF